MRQWKIHLNFLSQSKVYITLDSYKLEGIRSTVPEI